MALCAQLYIWHADACMGLAGASEDNPRLRAAYVAKAETHIDRATTCTCHAMIVTMVTSSLSNAR
jgi:hypothetical protein